jgi:hypothetical protein
MKKLKELLQEKGEIWFLIDEKDKKDFLRFAKDNGCKWVSGEEINVNEDDCWSIVGISKGFMIGNIGASIAFLSKSKAERIKFADYIAQL